MLQHALGDERLEVGQDQDVGLVAGRDRAEVIEPVVRGRVMGRHRERVLGRDAERDCVANHRVDVAVFGDVLRLAVVGAERDPVRAELLHEREQCSEVACRRCLADQQPHAGAQPLASLFWRCTPRDPT